MKKSLLFMALAAIAVGASAQTFKVKDARRNARVEMKAEPQQLSFQQSTLNTASRIARAPRRVTTEEPTVQAYRPNGFYWFLQNWNGSEAPAGLAIGPSGVENVFTADFSAESSKWVYSTERDGDQFLPQEVDVTESDSTLAVTYEPGFWPTPMAVVSSKVGTKLKNTLVADTAVFASYGLCVGFNSNGVLTNNDNEFVEMGVGNYDPNYFLGSSNAVGVFETNSEEAVTQLTELFGGEAAGVLSATTLGLGEYYPMNAESEALITSIDATFCNPDAAPTDEDVVAYLMPIVDGNIADPIAAFYLSESVEWQYDDNSHMGHSCHFVPEAPVLVSGDFFVQFVNVEGSYYQLAPTIPVVNDYNDGSYGYAIVELQVLDDQDQEQTKVILQSTNIFTFPNHPSYIVPSNGFLTHMTYDPVEIADYKTGISNTVIADRNATHTYDLQGRRVMGAQKGVFIVNGQKVIM